jgi:hypothetical protein
MTVEFSKRPECIRKLEIAFWNTLPSFLTRKWTWHVTPCDAPNITQHRRKTKFNCYALYVKLFSHVSIMFVCFESHEQFFSYLATVTIAGDRAANLDLCLALTAFSSEGSFTCHTYCDTGLPFLRSYPKDPWFYLLNAVLLAKEQSIPILNVLGLMRPARAGLELTTYRLLSENTTTRLRQPVYVL